MSTFSKSQFNNKKRKQEEVKSDDESDRLFKMAVKRASKDDKLYVAQMLTKKSSVAKKPKNILKQNKKKVASKKSWKDLIFKKNVDVRRTNKIERIEKESAATTAALKLMEASEEKKKKKVTFKRVSKTLLDSDDSDDEDDETYSPSIMSSRCLKVWKKGKKYIYEADDDGSAPENNDDDADRLVDLKETPPGNLELPRPTDEYNSNFTNLYPIEYTRGSGFETLGVDGEYAHYMKSYMVLSHMHRISLGVDKTMQYLMQEQGKQPHSWDMRLRLDHKGMQDCVLNEVKEIEKSCRAMINEIYCLKRFKKATIRHMYPGFFQKKNVSFGAEGAAAAPVPKNNAKTPKSAANKKTKKAKNAAPPIIIPPATPMDPDHYGMANFDFQDVLNHWEDDEPQGEENNGNEDRDYREDELAEEDEQEQQNEGEESPANDFVAAPMTPRAARTAFEIARSMDEAWVEVFGTGNTPPQQEEEEEQESSSGLVLPQTPFVMYSDAGAETFFQSKAASAEPGSKKQMEYNSMLQMARDHNKEIQNNAGGAAGAAASSSSKNYMDALMR